MGVGVDLVIGGASISVDGRDVARAQGVAGRPDGDDPTWRAAAEAYVDAHPRAGARVAEDQRLHILRRLAAGPATTAELLEAMRRVGWVGASDLENRLRDLRGTGARGGGRAVRIAVRTEGDLHRLIEPLPALDESSLRALGFVKSLVAQDPSPLAAQAVQLLDGMLPGVGAHTGERGGATMATRAVDVHRFEAARVTRTPVVVTYFSMNSGHEKRYLLVPVTYVPVGPALKAVCIDVDTDGTPVADRQFAVDRIRRVEPSDLPPLDVEATRLRTESLVVEVSDALHRIMQDRNQFGVRDARVEQVEVDRWRVHGRFPVALGWDVMEQMAAWAGQAVVLEPHWLANAVVRRLRAGLRAMEEGELELVKPDPDRDFPSLEAAIWDAGPATAPPPTGPTKLPPPAR